MKKILLTSVVIGFAIQTTAFAGSGFGYLTPTNESNRNFSTIMQRNFEKKETLDFQNNPEAYKEKRENKDKFLDYQEGKLDVTPDVKTQFNLQNTRPGNNNMQFIKDENGKIKIQGL